MVAVTEVHLLAQRAGIRLIGTTEQTGYGDDSRGIRKTQAKTLVLQERESTLSRRVVSPSYFAAVRNGG